MMTSPCGSRLTTDQSDSRYFKPQAFPEVDDCCMRHLHLRFSDLLAHDFQLTSTKTQPVQLFVAQEVHKLLGNLALAGMKPSPNIPRHDARAARHERMIGQAPQARQRLKQRVISKRAIYDPLVEPHAENAFAARANGTMCEDSAIPDRPRLPSLHPRHNLRGCVDPAPSKGQIAADVRQALPTEELRRSRDTVFAHSLRDKPSAKEVLNVPPH